MTTQDTDHDNHTDHDEHGSYDKPFAVTIKTLAGHKLHLKVVGSDLVAAVAVEATVKFRARHQLADDGADYALSLPRSGPDGNLDPSSTLLAAGIHADDELLLISRAPHVDG